MSHSSHADKNEQFTKEEWQTRLESFEFKQIDMNKLIMNYLVTGKCSILFITQTTTKCVIILFFCFILLL